MTTVEDAQRAVSAGTSSRRARLCDDVGLVRRLESSSHLGDGFVPQFGVSSHHSKDAIRQTGSDADTFRPGNRSDGRPKLFDRSRVVASKYCLTSGGGQLDKLNSDGFDIHDASVWGSVSGGPSARTERDFS